MTSMIHRCMRHSAVRSAATDCMFCDCRLHVDLMGAAKWETTQIDHPGRRGTPLQFFTLLIDGNLSEMVFSDANT